MCGILGIISENAKDQKNILEKMILSLSHRGPDSQGYFSEGNCLLGHTRFSIVDLVGGQQPMFTTDRSCAVVFNGEIYGYKELKDLYNYKYVTNSDTELLLAMYKKDDIGMFEKLNGMFAFAIWDQNKKRLIAGRDRFGEKPFYYSITEDGELIFASELKAILVSELIKPKINLDALGYYLRFLTTPANVSIFENIFVLPPGHYLIWCDKKLVIKSYWQPDKQNIDITLAEAKKEFERLFRQSIKRQLVADVPVGAFLSGGLDSSTVVAIASEYKKNIETFSFGFGDDINELPFAQSVANRFSTIHHELNAKDYDIADILIKMNDVYDEPFADSSNIPTFLISQFAGRKVRVVLSGDGGDELLGGYDHYRQFLMGNNKPTETSPNNYLYRLLKKITKNGKWEDYIKKKQFFRGMNEDSYLDTKSYFNPKEIESILLTNTAAPLHKEKRMMSINDLMISDIKNSFTADILVKTDRASMAIPLELRAPFLDKDLADFCLSLPEQFKANKSQGKLILRETFGYLWPKDIINRPKQGFGAPVNKWLKLEKVEKLVNEYLGDNTKLIYRYLDFKNVQKFRNKNNYQTWIILVLSLWFEKWGKYAE